MPYPEGHPAPSNYVVGRMKGTTYFDLLKGALTLLALGLVGSVVYRSWNSWPSIVGTWKFDREEIELLTFTPDGKLLVTEPRGVDVPLGTYTQDGPYIKVVSELVLNSKDDGHNRFTLKVDFVDQNTFTTDGPIGLYVFERRPVTLRRIPDSQAAQLKQSRSGS